MHGKRNRKFWQKCTGSLKDNRNISRMNIFRRLLFGCLLLTGAFTASAQLQMRVTKTDSAGLMVYLAANYGYAIPLADLRNETTNIMGVGADLCLKTKSNWSFETGFNYHFSGKVKGTDSLFRLITNSIGSIMDGDGQPADIDVDQRMWDMRLAAGKIFPISPYRRNAGIQVKIGGGYSQRYIYIKNPDNRVAALNGEYKKGYDRLTGGFSLYQFLGYVHLSKSQYTCFYIGMEATECFSKRLREWDFSLMGKDERSFTDVLVGIKAGWIIPLYKKEYQDAYYFR